MHSEKKLIAPTRFASAPTVIKAQVEVTKHGTVKERIRISPERLIPKPSSQLDVIK
jgi:hypothetical protein